MAESLTARVARLEAEVASLKGCLIGIVNEAVSAMAFELLNSDGEVVAELKTTEQDKPYFTVLDKDHTARFTVQLRNGRPILILGDQNGNTRLSFGEFNDGKMGLLVMAKDSSGDVLLGFGPNGEPFLKPSGLDGKVALDTSVQRFGLSLADKSEQYRLIVALDPWDHNRNPAMVMFDHKGRQRGWRV